MHGGAYFRNFTVWCKKGQKSRKSKTMVILHLHTSLHGVAYLRGNGVFTIFALISPSFALFAPY